MVPADASIDALLEQRARFLSFVRVRVSDRETAEDLLQAAYARVLERQPDVPRDARLVPWFYRVLRNAIIDRYRRTDVERRGRDAWERDPTRSAGSHSEGRQCACTRTALAALQPKYVEIIEAVELEGLAVVEVARRLSLTPGNAAVRLHRARRLLAERLKALCRHCANTACVDCHCKGSSPSASS